MSANENVTNKINKDRIPKRLFIIFLLYKVGNESENYF
jgi:hypothetical protein